MTGTGDKKDPLSSEHGQIESEYAVYLSQRRNKLCREISILK